MQSVLSRIWNRVAVSISYDDNDYTTGFIERDETVNHKVNTTYLHKTNKSRHIDLHGFFNTQAILTEEQEKVIHRELCNRLKFGHTDKWYIHKPESVQKMQNIRFSGILWSKWTTHNPDQKTQCHCSQQEERKSSKKFANPGYQRVVTYLAFC